MSYQNELKNKLSAKKALRAFFLAVYDCCAVALSLYLSILVYSISATGETFAEKYARLMPSFLFSLPFCIVFLLASFFVFKLYNSLWEYAGVNEALRMCTATIVSFIASYILIALIPHISSLPILCMTFATFLTLIFVAGIRFVYRVSRLILRGHQEKEAQSKSGKKKHIMIVGAGEAASLIIREINMSAALSSTKVACLVDDNKSKTGSYLMGIKIAGTREDIPRLVTKFDIDEIIVAIPSLGAEDRREILDICKDTGSRVKMLPSLSKLVGGEIKLSAIRNIEIEDLLERAPIETNLNSIMGYVKGKTVLVTGGGGSIGSELCRQIASHSPKMLVIVDIYENSIYDIQNELKTDYPDLNLVTLIGSVRDSARVDAIFDIYRPQIVYHAAAHKHVPLMEDSPNESVKNNVFGTLKCARAADYYGAERFILISTDKAVNPTNIMGATKRICEMIVQSYSKKSKTVFAAVRFGNVLGSNGSVIPLFKNQIEKGGPVLVTHPDIIRYFMTIPEAVSLVLQAGAYATGGEIFVLDMGQPVKILTLAENLIKLSGYTPYVDMDIKFTGLRPGEKLYEELLMAEEGLGDTANPLIHVGKPIEFDEVTLFSSIDKLYDIMYDDKVNMKYLIHEIVPTYHIDETHETPVEKELAQNAEEEKETVKA